MITLKEDNSGWSVEEKLYMPDITGKRGIDLLHAHGVEFVRTNDTADLGIAKNGDPVKGVPRNKCLLLTFEPPSQLGHLYDPRYRMQFMGSMAIVELPPGAGHFIIPRSLVTVAKYFDTPKTNFLCIVGRDMNFDSAYNKYDLTKKRLELIKFFTDTLGPSKFEAHGRWPAGPCYKGEPGPVAHGLAGYNLTCPATTHEAPCWDAKYAIFARHRFALCLENSTWPGYLGCKAIEAQCCGAIPLYVGATDVEKYMPPGTYINMKDKTNKELLGIIANMTEAEQETYRVRIRKWLNEQGNDVFSSYNFATKLLKALKVI